MDMGTFIEELWVVDTNPKITNTILEYIGGKGTKHLEYCISNVLIEKNTHVTCFINKGQFGNSLWKSRLKIPLRTIKNHIYSINTNRNVLEMGSLYFQVHA